MPWSMTLILTKVWHFPLTINEFIWQDLHISSTGPLVGSEKWDKVITIWQDFDLKQESSNFSHSAALEFLWLVPLSIFPACYALLPSFCLCVCSLFLFWSQWFYLTIKQGCTHCWSLKWGLFWIIILDNKCQRHLFTKICWHQQKFI